MLQNEIKEHLSIGEVSIYYLHSDRGAIIADHWPKN